METRWRLATPEAIAEAAAVLRGGGLVAFPTETVYGLGADALNAGAVRRIFQAKGRPATNPVIVHVLDEEAASEVVAEWPATARRLAEAFWPGPLTLVLPRRGCVPDDVTAGGPTVAVRATAHPVARALLHAAGTPLAAPSANPSLWLSPTTARHVEQGLAGRIEMILDGGATPGGIESTVIDLTTDPPRLLRPGLIDTEELGRVIGPVEAGRRVADGIARSPGQLARHYAPRTPLRIGGVELVQEQLDAGWHVGWLTHEAEVEAPAGVVHLRLPALPAGYAAGLYAALHELDDRGLNVIVVSEPPPGAKWAAVHDRLRRGSAAPE